MSVSQPFYLMIRLDRCGFCHLLFPLLLLFFFIRLVYEVLEMKGFYYGRSRLVYFFCMLFSSGLETRSFQYIQTVGTLTAD
jgi:hypothetical protein